jgi:hypothetical protein
VDIASGAVVNGGGVAEVGNGIVDIQANGDNQNVSFLKGGSGGLELADTAGNPSAFGGRVVGFGQNTKQFIDLTTVASGACVSLSYTSNGASSGVLTVTSGGSVVASINFSGSYTTSSFHLTSGAGGTVEIFDPPVLTALAGNHDRDDATDAGDGGNRDGARSHLGSIGSSTSSHDATGLTYPPTEKAISMFDSDHGAQLDIASEIVQAMQSFSPADSANLLYSSSPPNEQLTSEPNDLRNTPSHLDHWNADARSQIAFDSSSSIKTWDIAGQDHRTPHTLAATRSTLP